MAALAKCTGLFSKFLLNRALTRQAQAFSTSRFGKWANKKGDGDEIPDFIPTVPEDFDEEEEGPLGGRHFSPPTDQQLKKAQELFDTLLKGSGAIKSGQDSESILSSGPSSKLEINKAKELFETFDKNEATDLDLASSMTSSEVIEGARDLSRVDHAPSQDQLVRAQQLFENLSGMFANAETEQEPAVEYDNFASMLRKSSYVGLGNPRGSLASGRIFDVVDDDLYVDFGGKFHAVCKAPAEYVSKGTSSQG